MNRVITQIAVIGLCVALVPSAHAIGKKKNKKQKNNKSGYRPIDRTSRKEKPPEDEEQKGNRLNQTATKIIQNLPS